MNIGFVGETARETDKLFQIFLYENREEIEKRGSNWAKFKDGTFVKEVIDFKYCRYGFVFDQIILAGIAAIIPSYEVKAFEALSWSAASEIPEEFRILHMTC